MADEEVEWAGEAGKALLTGGITTSIFGIVGAFIGFGWYDAQLSPGCTEILVVLGKCTKPALPIWGTVDTHLEAATAFGTGIAVATLLVCAFMYLSKKSSRPPAKPAKPTGPAGGRS
jgi:hypothetical protein